MRISDWSSDVCSSDLGRFREGKIMGLIITLIVGGIIGWMASIVMRTDAQQGIILNVVVGIVGAFLGSFLGSFFGMGASLDTFSPIVLLWAFIGAEIGRASCRESVLTDV